VKGHLNVRIDQDLAGKLRATKGEVKIAQPNLHQRFGDLSGSGGRCGSVFGFA
jgi:hypothetical protein